MSLEWTGGQPYSARFGDVYFSRDSGLEETRHVFLRGNRLAERFASLRAGENFCIGETGFGTGLSFLCVWQLFEQSAPPGASLDFFSVEKFPLHDDELRAALALWPEFGAQAEVLLARWCRRVPGWNRWSFAGGRIRLTLALDDVAETLPQLPAGSVDAWFLDGFAPAKNPEMWGGEVPANIARASRDGATLATYTSAGWVRRGLGQAGFVVERVPGFGRKREMMTGLKLTPSSLTGEGEYFGVSHPLSPSPSPASGEGSIPRTTLVIGGGIAGCAAAYALAQRGIRVTLIERAPQLASAASGNPRGILHARFGAGDNPLHRFVLAAYGYALQWLDEVSPVDGAMRAECGLLQLACKPVEKKRIAHLAEKEWPTHLLQFVDAVQAGHLAGVEMQYGGLWFPSGGWVVPPALCAALVRDTRISQRLGHEVAALEQNSTGWRASGLDAQGEAWSQEAEVALVCCAHEAKKLAPFAHFPLIPVRGQITVLPETGASKALQTVVCGDGYCAPSVHGAHVIGATHAFEDESTEVRAADHAENLTSLAEYAPSLRQALGARDEAQLNGRASIRCSAPGSMPLIGKVQQGLYCSLAHGTRGLLTAGIAGEVLAAQVCGQLPPLPASILAVLDPLPRVRHQG
ncbi:MAG: bifunctional tRNA (5-methylaminomethyl-2-thiouridine)(34)-methyltransferase MnmD/FAD-dependent 5-carboxymethylaminomethyl-2-thiouridine(34) oxidoreductase MnmC [Gallionellaceae bacterium]|nr:MAG: bifunctional tRNA (5-methylaminomethyl-2-thiouridine)(34)-methyltransferase MnmD/FAD-dependent 5-carboxymethylaminomethyl-2-thiouridine(34) oxidoreductase MnmC [Gallionellaceae bacterium]